MAVAVEEVIDLIYHPVSSYLSLYMVSIYCCILSREARGKKNKGSNSMKGTVITSFDLECVVGKT